MNIIVLLVYSYGLQMNVWKPLVKLNRLNKHKPTIIFKDTLWYWNIKHICQKYL